jgi:uncharacterized low-complexity protein
MNKHFSKKPLALALGAMFTLAGGAAQASVFQATDLGAGYMVAGDAKVEAKAEAKAGEAACGANCLANMTKAGKTEADAKAACDKAKAEGKCGNKKEKKEGKCGEGKCGTKK